MYCFVIVSISLPQITLNRDSTLDVIVLKLYIMLSLGGRCHNYDGVVKAIAITDMSL